MIPVTKLDGQSLVINGDLVERIEASPDTIISLTSGRKILVRESVSELMNLLALNRRREEAEQRRAYSMPMMTGEAAMVA